MGDNSAIEWTDATWNPVTGCTKVSPGCKHCYAERLALRLHAMGNPRYRRGFDVTLHEDQLELPLRWKSPRRIFVNSMSYLFHDDVSVTFIERAFEVMGRAHSPGFCCLRRDGAHVLENRLRRTAVVPAPFARGGAPDVRPAERHHHHLLLGQDHRPTTTTRQLQLGTSFLPDTDWGSG